MNIKSKKILAQLLSVAVVGSAFAVPVACISTPVINVNAEETEQAVKNIDFKKYINEAKLTEYAILTAKDASGNTVWTYETKEYPVAQCARVEELGENNDVYYIVEGGTIVAFELETGKILWENSDFDGAGIAFAFGENAIYVSGYLAPDFYAVSYEGETLKRIPHLDENYSDSNNFWPYSIEIIDNKYAAITFEANEGNKLYVDLETYEVLENIESETPTEEPALTYEWYVEPSIEADDINSVGVFMEPIPNGSYDDYEYNYGWFIDTGYAVIKEGDFYGVIDMDGNIVIDTDYVSIRGELNDHFVLYDEDDNISYFCCETGEFLQPEEPYCAWCGDDLSTSVCDSYYCYDPESDLLVYIGTMPADDTEEVVSLQGQNCSNGAVDFPEGKTIPVRLVSIDGDDVTLTDEYAIMRDGEFVTYFVYDNVLAYKDGITAVEVDGEWYYFDEDGNQIIYDPCDASYSFGNADIPYLPSEDCIAFNTLWGGGYYATDGEVIIPVGEFAEVRPVFNGLAWVKDHETGLWGVIQLTGERAGTPNNDDDSDDGGSNSGGSSSSGSTGKESPKTGDDSGKIFALLALSAGVMVASRKRKEK